MRSRVTGGLRRPATNCCPSRAKNNDVQAFTTGEKTFPREKAYLVHPRSAWPNTPPLVFLHLRDPCHNPAFSLQAEKTSSGFHQRPDIGGSGRCRDVNHQDTRTKV